MNTAHLIQNTQKRVFSIPMKIKEAGSEVLLLRPGMNTITDEMLQYIHTMPSVVEWFEQGWLDIMRPPEGSISDVDENGIPSIDITAMTAVDAIKYVNNFYDENKLRDMYAKENRPTVKTAIANQIKKFEDVVKKED